MSGSQLLTGQSPDTWGVSVLERETIKKIISGIDKHDGGEHGRAKAPPRWGHLLGGEVTSICVFCQVAIALTWRTKDGTRPEVWAGDFWAETWLTRGDVIHGRVLSQREQPLQSDEGILGGEVFEDLEWLLCTGRIIWNYLWCLFPCKSSAYKL